MCYSPVSFKVYFLQVFLEKVSELDLTQTFVFSNKDNNTSLSVFNTVKKKKIDPASKNDFMQFL